MSPGAVATAQRQGAAGIRGAGVAVVIADDEGVCLESSQAACRILERARAEVVGRPLEEQFSGDARERFTHFWLAFRDGGGHGGPFRLGSRDGAEIELTISAESLASRHHRLTIKPLKARPAARTVAATGRSQRRPSRRECEILGLLADGNTDVQIAAELGLSPATVQTHVRNAKAKLGARTRAQAVVLALQQCLIVA